MPLLLSDFPRRRLRQKFHKQLLTHRLRNEIVATVVANKIVNRMGLVHPFELAEEEGAGLAEIGSAFVCASNLLKPGCGMGCNRCRRAMPEGARLALFDHAAIALHGHMADLMRAGGCHASPAQFEAETGEHRGPCCARIATCCSATRRARACRRSPPACSKAGAPEELARMVAQLFAMDGAIGIARLSHACKVDPLALTRAFSDLGKRLRLDWAQNQAAAMNPSDPWERLLVAGLARDFQQMRLDFLRELGPRCGKGKTDIAARLDRWAERERRGHQAPASNGRPGAKPRWPGRRDHARSARQPSAQPAQALRWRQAGTAMAAPLDLGCNCRERLAA